MVDSTTLAQRIAKAIDNSPHSVRDIASGFGISEPAVYAWMRTGRIAKDKLARLAQLTGQPLEYFLVDSYRPSAAPRIRVESHAGRLPFESIADAIKVLSNYLEITGDPPEWISDPVLLEIAHQVVVEGGKPVVPDNLLDLTKRLAARVREGRSHERATATGTGAATGRTHR